MPGTIWVISELYHPEDNATGHLLTHIAEGLAERYPVRVLCSQPTYNARGTRAPVCEEHGGVPIRRCRATALNKNVLVLRVINLVTISIALFVQTLARVRRGDFVLVVTNPPLLPFLVAAACKLRGAPFLLLIHDVYPEVLAATGMVKPDALLARGVDALSRRLYRGAERIIVLGRDMARLVAPKLGPARNNLVVIPNWADLDQVCPTPRPSNALLRKLGLTDKFVVLYAGNMGRTHGLEGLAQAAATLRSDTDTHFLFVGSGAKRLWLENVIRASGLGNMTVLGNRPRSEQQTFLNACDVAVISFVPGMAGVSVPSRMYNLLAAGKPILAVADADSELALVVEEEAIGWVVPPGRPDQTARAIREARSDPERLAQMGRRARRVAESKYSLRHAITAYQTMIADLEAARHPQENRLPTAPESVPRPNVSGG